MLFQLEIPIHKIFDTTFK